MQKEQKEQESSQETPSAPWMKEAQLRTIIQPGPITHTEMEIIQNTQINENPTTLEHDNPFKEQVLVENRLNSLDKQPGLSSNKQTFVEKTKEVESKGYSAALPLKSNKEKLQPIRKPDTSSVTSFSTNQEQDENKPPLSSASTSVLEGKKSNLLPPLRYF
jgi:hypothetical protein